MCPQIFFACIVTQAVGDNTWAYFFWILDLGAKYSWHRISAMRRRVRDSLLWWVFRRGGAAGGGSKQAGWRVAAFAWLHRRAHWNIGELQWRSWTGANWPGCWSIMIPPRYRYLSWSKHCTILDLVCCILIPQILIRQPQDTPALELFAVPFGRFEKLQATFRTLQSSEEKQEDASWIWRVWLRSKFDQLHDLLCEHDIEEDRSSFDIQNTPRDPQIQIRWSGDFGSNFGPNSC